LAGWQDYSIFTSNCNVTIGGFREPSIVCVIMVHGAKLNRSLIHCLISLNAQTDQTKDGTKSYNQ